MKKTILLFTIILGSLFSFTQNVKEDVNRSSQEFSKIEYAFSGDSCFPPQNLHANVLGNDEIELLWNSPSMNFPMSGISNSNADNSKDFLDLQFNYPTSFNGEAGVESDGNYIYTTNWKSSGIYKYELDGTFVDSITIDWVSAIRDMAYVPSTGYMYATRGVNELYVLDLENELLVERMNVPTNARAIAYDNDLDLFYINSWSSDIYLIDRETGDSVSSFPCGSYGEYHGFAYDNWSDGGPYLWGFSKDGNSNSTLVQIQLPDGDETGFVYDVSFLSTSGDGYAGGLFTQPDIVEETVTIGGVIQNEVIFGLELYHEDNEIFLDGYNIYMNNMQYNTEIITDTLFNIPDPGPGTYSFEVSSVYVDSFDNFICESIKEGPVEVTIGNGFTIGGNIIAGLGKLDYGRINMYQFVDNEIIHSYETALSDFGYFFFTEINEGYYIIQAQPTAESSSFETHVPTYHGNQLHWEDVEASFFEQNSYNNDISLIEIAETATGTGLISGSVFEDNISRETPLNEALVFLLNSDNECVAFDYTNNAGEFVFGNLDTGTFKLLVEIAGKSMNPIPIVLNETNTEKTGINLIVTSDRIFLGIDDYIKAGINHIGQVFPNPARDIASIRMSMNEKSVIKIHVYDIRGQMMMKEKFMLEIGENILDFDVSRFNKGVYYISIIGNKQVITTRKLLLNN